jgi:hypothetical protein
MILITLGTVGDSRQLVDFLLDFCELVEPISAPYRVKGESTGNGADPRIADPGTGVTGLAF